MVKRMVAGFLFLLLMTASLPAKSYTGRCTAVKDGDVITVSIENREEDIRLAGIDCPESDQQSGPEAKDFLSKLVMGKEVHIEEKSVDYNKRKVAVVKADGKDVSLELLEAGLAWYLKGTSPDEQYRISEESARGKKIGLWAQNNPTPPWVFRQRKSNITPVGMTESELKGKKAPSGSEGSQSPKENPETVFARYHKLVLSNNANEAAKLLTAECRKMMPSKPGDRNETIEDGGMLLPKKYSVVSSTTTQPCAQVIIKSEDARDRGMLNVVDLLQEKGQWKINSIRITEKTDNVEDMFTAAQMNNIELMKSLVKKNPSLINCKNSLGKTPLFYAVFGGSERAVNYLLSIGAQVNARDIAGETPLHIAAGPSVPAGIMKILLDKGATVNVKTKDDGSTPMHLAAQWGNVEKVKLLLSKGADANAKNNFGSTPLKVAELKSAKDVVNLLRSYEKK